MFGSPETGDLFEHFAIDYLTLRHRLAKDGDRGRYVTSSQEQTLLITGLGRGRFTEQRLDQQRLVSLAQRIAGSDVRVVPPTENARRQSLIGVGAGEIFQTSFGRQAFVEF